MSAESEISDSEPKSVTSETSNKQARDRIDFPDSGDTWVSDEAVTEVVKVLDFAPFDWRGHFDVLPIDDDADEEDVIRACIAAGLAKKVDPAAFAEMLADAQGDLESFVLQAVPNHVHYTPDFMSDSPGYCGPIYHLQWGGGPSFLTNVTRSVINGNGERTEHPEGYRVYHLDPH